jgi:phosphatidylserine/phosphatidylglycerophosphate/cardiolipin synthase-like enzyme
MPDIVRATAYANNEVAFLAWEVDGRIPGCLGFEIMRQYLSDTDQVTSEVPLAAYVAFKGQSNKHWKAQNTSVWPVQKFSWRDLTLRKRRDSATRRPDEVRVRYRVRALGSMRPGLEAVVARVETTGGKPNTYEGTPLALGYLGEAVVTNPVLITRHRPPFHSTFTNGILSAQWLVNALTEDDGRIADGELKARLVKPGDSNRSYLAGDSLPLIHDFFDRPGGRFRMALYELDDVELAAIITDNASRIDLILSNTGKGDDEEDDDEGKVWDARNAAARRRLIALAARPRTKFRLQHRMFNNSIQIGHNKFVVWCDDAGVPRSVLTGSTNWTWTGLTGQSNNCIRIDDDTIAAAYLEYWQRLHADEQPLPEPLGASMQANHQGEALRRADTKPETATFEGGSTAEVWFAPNMIARKYGKDPETPPDLDRVFALMRRAKAAIFFLVFYPSRQGLHSIVAEAINLGLLDKSLLVVGAVSSAEAMFNFQPKTKSETGADLPADAPFVYARNRISVVRAAAITDRQKLKPFGDFRNEILKVGNAIIHDKILVLDPLDPEACTVVFGSHNLGFKASYSNDENLVIVRGHRALAEAYAVHVLDVFDHYRFRAAEAQLRADGKKGWDGFLDRTDAWQDHASTLLSRYFAR